MIYSGDSENPKAIPIEEINRKRRGEALQETDWTQVDDCVLSDEAKVRYKNYRQALRDITLHQNWPNLDDEDWPTLET